MIITISCEISSLNGKNRASYSITYSGGAYGEHEGEGLEWTSDPIACDVSKPCTIEAVVYDRLSEGTATATVPIAFTLMEFYNTGKGVAFGKVATRDGLDCAMPAYFTGGVYIDGKSLADYIAELIRGS